MIRVARTLFPALGLLFLGYLIGKLGPAVVWHSLVTLRWHFLLVLALACGWHVSNTIAWACAFPPGAFRPRLWSLYMAKLAGEAVNQVTPLANLGGEPLKAYLLRQQAPASLGLASVVINKTGQVVAGLLFTCMGLSLVVLYWPLPLNVPLSVQAGLTTIVVCAVLLLLFVWRQQSRMFSSLLGLLRRVGASAQLVEGRLAGAARVDHNIGQFYREHGLRFGLVVLFHGIGWLLGAVETLVILRGLGAGASFAVAFLITSLTVIINSLFFFMPSNIGVLEGGQVFLLSTLGLDPAMGLAMGIAKRVRKVLWIVVGLLFLAHLGRGALTRPAAADTLPAWPAVRPRSAASRLKQH